MNSATKLNPAAKFKEASLREIGRRHTEDVLPKALGKTLG